MNLIINEFDSRHYHLTNYTINNTINVIKNYKQTHSNLYHFYGHILGRGTKGRLPSP
jgi:hypothetical protein